MWFFSLLLFAAAPASAQDQELYHYLETGDLGVWPPTGEVREQGRDPQNLFYQARGQLAAGDLKAAGASLEDLTRARGPFAAAGWGLLAECALRQDELEKAAACLERVRQQAPQSGYWTRFRQAQLHYFQGRFKEAAALLEQLARQDAGHPRANDALELLLLLERYQDHPEDLQVFARAQLRRCQGQDPGPEWARLEAQGPLQDLSLLERARSQAAGDPEAALLLYQRLIEGYPQSPYLLEALLGRARLREARGELEEALKGYETALLQFPENARLPEVRLQIQRLRRLQGGGG